MPIHNAEIAEAFGRMADLLDIEGANPFRVRAYRNASRVISGLGKNLADMINERADLSEFPGIGQDLAQKIEELVRTRELKALTELERRAGKGIAELMSLPGLGPKRVKSLHEQLNISTLKQLEKAAKAGKVSKLRGFGQKAEQRILAALKGRAQTIPRLNLSVAERIALPLIIYLKKCPDVLELSIAGSFRRRQETVGDLDIVVSAVRSAEVMRHFLLYEDIQNVISQGPTRSSAMLRLSQPLGGTGGFQADLRVVTPKSYGAALLYFTGSKAHNIAIRTLALKRKLTLNEYGVFRGKRQIAGRSEEEVYRTVGLPYIEPELRELRGEMEAAQKGKLPKLIVLDNLKGDLHCHTNASDGLQSLEELAQAGMNKGYSYIAVTDHSKRVTIAKGLTARRLAAQIERIDRINADSKGITLLKGIEVDILEDGSLDLPDWVLEKLDFCVCSIHSKFNLTRAKQTERIIRAMDNKHFNILAHPSGRLLGRREPMELDLERIFSAAKERGCFLEVNSQPDRLDLNDSYCRLAKKLGVKVAISSDAHNSTQLDFMRYGVDQARRGWLTAEDVLNTRTLSTLRKLLSR